MSVCDVPDGRDEESLLAKSWFGVSTNVERAIRSCRRATKHTFRLLRHPVARGDVATLAWARARCARCGECPKMMDKHDIKPLPRHR